MTILISLCRSLPQNRLPPWIFNPALKRKLRLPLFDETDKPFCPCGRHNDPFGDHIFQCRRINKIGAHNFIRDGFANTLGPSSPPLDISSHPPLSILNHNSTYLPTHMHDHLTSPSTQIHHPHPSSIMPAHTLPLALMSQSPVHHHALPLILPLPMSQQY